MAAAPEGYTPHYFRVTRAGKAPATEFGSWKTDDARLTVEEAIAWMEQGGNVGIGGRPEDPLVNGDIDDDEETTPADLPETTRAISRSRTGFHTWFFNPAGDIPNIPTDDAGEIRTDWQYVVAPGSFVASAAEEILDDATDPGYYTLEHAAPVATLDYDGLPEVFREFHEAVAESESEAGGEDGHLRDADDQAGAGPTPNSGGDSAVTDIDPSDLVSQSDASARWASVFHASDTSANMSISDDGTKLTCCRHHVTHFRRRTGGIGPPIYGKNSIGPWTRL